MDSTAAEVEAAAPTASENKLRSFALLLGADFNRQDTDAVLRAYEDFVYFLNFGWASIPGFSSTSSAEFTQFHESSLDYDSNDIFVEDLLDVGIKVYSKKFHAEDSALAASPVFRNIQMDSIPVWLNEFANKFPEQTMLYRGFAKAFNCRSLPMMLPRFSCPPASSSICLPNVAIADESLISLAKRAGCISMHRDCYDELRHAALRYASILLATTFKSLNNGPRTLLVASDIQEAIYDMHRQRVCGYGFRGIRRAFDSAILRVSNQVRNGGVDTTALGVIDDLIHWTLERILETAVAEASPFQPVSLPVTAFQITTTPADGDEIEQLCVSGRMVITKIPGEFDTAVTEVPRLLTKEHVIRAVCRVCVGALTTHALAEGNKAIEKYQTCLNVRESADRMLCGGLGFGGENIAVLAKEYFDVTLTDEAAIYAAAVMEYMSAEILELSHNNTRDLGDTVVHPRNVMSAISNDEELFQMYDNIIYRGAGTVLPPLASSSKAWSYDISMKLREHSREERGPTSSAEQDYDSEMSEDEHHPRSYDSYLRSQSHEDEQVVHAFTGFILKSKGDGYYERELKFDHVANITSKETRRQRRERALAIPWHKAFLAKELPTDSSMETLQKVKLAQLRITVNNATIHVAQNTSMDIDRCAIKTLVSQICTDPELSCGKKWKFTHEAMNVLQLGIEHFLFQLLEDCCGRTLMAELTTVRSEDIRESMQLAELVIAANSNNRDHISLLLCQGANVNGQFCCQSALMSACDRDDDEMMQWLIDRGADVNLVHKNANMRQLTKPDHVIGRAAKFYRQRVLKLLLRPQHADTVKFSGTVSGGLNGLMSLCQLPPEANIDIDLIEEFLSRGIDINAVDGRGKSALQHACEYQNIAVAEKLILLGANTEKRDFHPEPVSLFKKAEARERFEAAKQLVSTSGLK